MINLRADDITARDAVHAAVTDETGSEGRRVIGQWEADLIASEMS